MEPCGDRRLEKTILENRIKVGVATEKGRGGGCACARGGRAGGRGGCEDERSSFLWVNLVRLIAGILNLSGSPPYSKPLQSTCRSHSWKSLMSSTGCRLYLFMTSKMKLQL